MKKENDNWSYIIEMRERNRKQNTTRVQRLRDYSDQIADRHRRKKEWKEIRYREWLKNPTRKGKEIKLLTYEELRKMRNRFLYIAFICWMIGCSYVFFLWNQIFSSGDIGKITNATWMCFMLIGFAHIFLAAGIDYAIYRRWGDDRSLIFGVLEEAPE